MKPELNTNKVFFSNIHVGCFGDFKIEDQVCRKLCILSLRCAIEREQNLRIEMLDEMLSTESEADIIH